MSLEPQTTAKVRIHTNKGAIDLELWAKETPITSRIFLTNVLNDRFVGWEFNRVLKDFIAQTSGLLNQEPFADEFHTRIRYSRRGMLGSVNLSSKNSNTGHFFITLRETPELQNKNTAFGKVVGDGIFTVLKINEGQLGDDGETPIYPTRITKCEVLIPYFDDLVKDAAPLPPQTKIEDKDKKHKQKKKNKVRLHLEVDEEIELDVKMKSAHDVLDDKRLAKEEVVPEEVVELRDEPQKKTTDQPIDIQRDEKLENIRAQINVLKQDLNAPKVRKEVKLSSKMGKEQRESETLLTLRQFEKKMKVLKTQEKTVTSTNDLKTDDLDDLDNLDDSDSDTDIYYHALKFADNDNNDKLANEDLLITIDDRQQKEEQKKRRSDGFYKDHARDPFSILKRSRNV